jgi:hypothetical protein
MGYKGISLKISNSTTAEQSINATFAPQIDARPFLPIEHTQQLKQAPITSQSGSNPLNISE